MFKTLTALVLTAKLLAYIQNGGKKNIRNKKGKTNTLKNAWNKTQKLSFGWAESLLGARYGVDQKNSFLPRFVYLFYWQNLIIGTFIVGLELME